jgi:hypothetical protein
VFAVPEYATVPVPLPDAGDAVSQDASLETVQPDVHAPFTDTVNDPPVPPAARIEPDDGLTDTTSAPQQLVFAAACRPAIAVRSAGVSWSNNDEADK